MTFLRPDLGEAVSSSLHLRSLLADSRVTLVGLVVCRQRQLTAHGIIFLLLEDEYGVVNVLVSRELDEEEGAIVRTARFVEVDGVLDQRAGQQRTLIATSLREIIPRGTLVTPEGKNWA